MYLTLFFVKEAKAKVTRRLFWNISVKKFLCYPNLMNYYAFNNYAHVPILNQFSLISGNKHVSSKHPWIEWMYFTTLICRFQFSVSSTNIVFIHLKVFKKVPVMIKKIQNICYTLLTVKHEILFTSSQKIMAP